MAALKRSLAQETGEPVKATRKAAIDRRQTNLLLPVSSKGRKEPNGTPIEAAPTRRRKKA
jgi:hypothetical protein